MAQALGVVHILVSGKATKYRLTQQTDQCVAAVLACARTGRCLDRHRRQAECIIQFAVTLHLANAVALPTWPQPQQQQQLCAA
jgi:hypothetical protein